MILGIGLDIVNIDRIRRIIDKSHDNFIKRILSEEEIKIYSKFTNKDRKINYLAKRFSAKESLSKAVGLGIGKDIRFIDISVLNDKNGKPYIVLSQGLQLFIQDFFKYDDIKFNISLSDEGNISQSIVIISSNTISHL